MNWMHVLNILYIASFINIVWEVSQMHLLMEMGMIESNAKNCYEHSL